MKATILAPLVILVAALPAFAAIDKKKADPKDAAETESSFTKHVIQARERARESYRMMRERRLMQLESAAKRTSGGKATDGVPGWRGTASVSDSTVEGADSPVVPLADGQEPQPGDEMTKDLPGGGNFFVYLAGAGVLLALALRFLRTHRFQFHLGRGGREEEEEEAETGAITVTLRPRKERGFGG